MKYNKGFTSMALLFIIGIVIVAGGAYFVGKNSAMEGTVINDSEYSPTKEQEYIQQSTNSNNSPKVSQAQPQVQQQVQQSNDQQKSSGLSCASTDTPSIIITSPTSTTVYNAGQQATITWTSCNVDKILIGWGQGGHDNGAINSTPIATPLGMYHGTYQWTVPSYNGVQGAHWIAVNQAIVQPNNNFTTGIFTKSDTFTIQ